MGTGWAFTSRRPAAVGATASAWSRPTRSSCGRRPARRARWRKSARRCFAAPLAPHLAAAAEGKRLDTDLLRRGLDVWRERSDVVIIEGAGGLMSPLGEDEYVADLAYDFGFPLVIVANNALGAINHVLQTLVVAATFREGLSVAGVVLNEAQAGSSDASVASNAREIRARGPAGAGGSAARRRIVSAASRLVFARRARRFADRRQG